LHFGRQSNYSRGNWKPAAGQFLSLPFEKPSLLTRVTFELAIKQLGGESPWRF